MQLKKKLPPCALGTAVEEVEEVNARRITNGDEGPAVENAIGESLEHVATSPNIEQEKRRGPSALSVERIKEGSVDILQFRKVIEMMQQRIEEQEEKMAKMEQRNTELENMAVLNNAQAERMVALEYKLFRKP